MAHSELFPDVVLLAPIKWCKFETKVNGEAQDTAWMRHKRLIVDAPRTLPVHRNRSHLDFRMGLLLRVPYVLARECCLFAQLGQVAQPGQVNQSEAFCNEQARANTNAALA